jgi:preprotein translocase subunit SecE
MGPNKYVHLLFAVGSLLAAFLLSKTGDWVWSYFAKPNELIINVAAVFVAAVLGVLAYRNERAFAAAYDVTRELEKVTWPTRKETSAATVVVLVTVSIASVILWGFDLIWGSLANWVMRGS